jgi:hypothetical protein
MSKYCIMRFQKYKLGSVANIERHQQHRERLKHRMASRILEDDLSQNILKHKSIGDSLFETL